MTNDVLEINIHSIHNEALYLMEMAYQGSNMHQTHARARLEIDFSTLSLGNGRSLGVNGRSLGILVYFRDICKLHGHRKNPNFPKTSTETPDKKEKF